MRFRDVDVVVDAAAAAAAIAIAAIAAAAAATVTVTADKLRLWLYAIASTIGVVVQNNFPEKYNCKEIGTVTVSTVINDDGRVRYGYRHRDHVAIALVAV